MSRRYNWHSLVLLHDSSINTPLLPDPLSSASNLLKPYKIHVIPPHSKPSGATLRSICDTPHQSAMIFISTQAGRKHATVTLSSDRNRPFLLNLREVEVTDVWLAEAFPGLQYQGEGVRPCDACGGGDDVVDMSLCSTNKRDDRVGRSNKTFDGRTQGNSNMTSPLVRDSHIPGPLVLQRSSMYPKPILRPEMVHDHT